MPVKHHPVIQADRDKARASAAAIRSAIADPATAGERHVTRVDLYGPRRVAWLTTWANLPGLMFDADRRTYTHWLFPGWEYNRLELETEMADDLEKFAETGERPGTATTRNTSAHGRRPHNGCYINSINQVD